MQLCSVLHLQPVFLIFRLTDRCATTQVGLVDGESLFNPTAAQKEVSELALTVASTREKVIMIEAGANEVPEAKMIEAILRHMI